MAQQTGAMKNDRNSASPSDAFLGRPNTSKLSLNPPESGTVDSSRHKFATKSIENRKADSPVPDTSDSGEDDNGTGGDLSDDDAYKSDLGPNNKKNKHPKPERRSRARAKSPHPNGRFVGRQLVMWHRPRMIEKLILHVQYECQRAGLHIPWDKAVQRLTPGSNGTAAIQHLNRLRDILVTEGHLVPPLLGKMGTAQDPEIRGYIRDMEGKTLTATRVVDWNEKIVDRKQSLLVPGIIRGSGNYRRKIYPEAETRAESADGGNFNVESATIKHTESRHGRHPPKKSQEGCSTTKSRRTIRPSYKARRAKRGKAGTMVSRMQDVDPAELDSDDDYDPTAINGSKSTARRSTRKAIKVEYDSDMEMDGASTENEFNNEARAINEDNSPTTPAKLNFEDGTLITPPASALSIVKLSLDPRKLAHFPAGVSGRITINLFETPLKQHNSVKHSASDKLGNDSSSDSPSAPRSKKVAKLKHDGTRRYINQSTSASNIAGRSEPSRFDRKYMSASNVEVGRIADEELLLPPPKMGLLFGQSEIQANGSSDSPQQKVAAANRDMPPPQVYGQPPQSMPAGYQVHTNGSSPATNPFDPANLSTMFQQDSANTLDFDAHQTALGRAYSMHGFRAHQAGLIMNGIVQPGTEMAPPHSARRHSTSLSHGLPDTSYQMLPRSHESITSLPRSNHGSAWPANRSYPPLPSHQTWEDLSSIMNDARGDNPQYNPLDSGNQMSDAMIADDSNNAATPGYPSYGSSFY